MKGPSRPAPSVPGVGVNRYSPVTNWNDDPFGADVFEPNPQYMQKKKPPPRPPPPKVNPKQPDVPLKPSHFIRKPTVLSSLLSRKNKAAVNSQTQNGNVNIISQSLTEYSNDLDAHKMFPKCEPKNIQTGALIDLSSPPSSPTFTTRSSSDGLSVDSFGSDATTSTNHHNLHNGGNASQAESGFEDDFDLFLNSRKTLPKEDTLDDFAAVDPFSPTIKPPVMKKPVLNKDFFDTPGLINNQNAVSLLKGPTIIRAKPARPKPPDNSALLKNTFGGGFPISSMTINTTTPIQKVCNGFGDFESKPLSWEDEGSPEREWSPPMPSVPPPPPPAADDDLPPEWCGDATADLSEPLAQVPDLDDEPHAIALFDYFTDHPDDLCFSAGSKIKLIRRVDDEWLYGGMRSGVCGLFPANYVEVKVPLPQDPAPPPRRLASATALYDFEPVQPGDLRFLTGDTINVMYKLNDEWYFGECNGLKGQFPVNYVQMS
ncbi:SH3 domain-containing protein 19 isoform X2 [Pectinophora gossypiella]|nr:SH3 domain-containing protein 19 isoform X2 [Pectinophora gossypiella]